MRDELRASLQCETDQERRKLLHAQLEDLDDIEMSSSRMAAMILADAYSPEAKPQSPPPKEPSVLPAKHSSSSYRTAARRKKNTVKPFPEG